MSSRVKSRVLRALGFLYQPEGGQTGIGSADFDSPLQFVHDVARGAGQLAVLPETGGFFTDAETISHAGADGQTVQMDPYERLSTIIGFDARVSYRIWLFDWSFVSAAAASLDPAGVRLSIEFVGASANDVIQDSNFFLGIGTAESAVATTLTGNVMCLFGNQPTINQPRFIPVGALLSVFDSSAAAGTHGITWLLWAGPLGQLPPAL